jgi:hypothetical protein
MTQDDSDAPLGITPGDCECADCGEDIRRFGVALEPRALCSLCSWRRDPELTEADEPVICEWGVETPFQYEEGGYACHACREVLSPEPCPDCRRDAELFTFTDGRRVCYQCGFKDRRNR